MLTTMIDRAQCGAIRCSQSVGWLVGCWWCVWGGLVSFGCCLFFISRVAECTELSAVKWRFEWCCLLSAYVVITLRYNISEKLHTTATTATFHRHRIDCVTYDCCCSCFFFEGGSDLVIGSGWSVLRCVSYMGFCCCVFVGVLFFPVLQKKRLSSEHESWLSTTDFRKYTLLFCVYLIMLLLLPGSPSYCCARLPTYSVDSRRRRQQKRWWVCARECVLWLVCTYSGSNKISLLYPINNKTNEWLKTSL